MLASIITTKSIDRVVTCSSGSVFWTRHVMLFSTPTRLHVLTLCKRICLYVRMYVCSVFSIHTSYLQDITDMQLLLASLCKHDTHENMVNKYITGIGHPCNSRQHIRYIHTSYFKDIANIQDNWYWSISSLRPRSSSRSSPGTYFKAFPLPSILELVLKHF